MQKLLSYLRTGHNRQCQGPVWSSQEVKRESYDPSASSATLELFLKEKSVSNNQITKQWHAMVSLKSCTFRAKERIPLTCILHLLHYNVTWRLEVGDHHKEGITNCLTERLRRLSPNVVILSGGAALVVFKRCIHHSNLKEKSIQLLHECLLQNGNSV